MKRIGKTAQGGRMAQTPLIIEVALNGQTPKSQNPNVPYSDDEIVEQALACMDAGAAIVHNHTQEPIFGGTGKFDSEAYARPWRRVLEARPDAILVPTMPVGQQGVPVEVRYSHIVAMAKEGLIAQGLCDPGSFNLSLIGADGLFAPSDMIYRNDMNDSHYYVETCRELNLGLSVSIFEPGFLKFMMAYVRAGKLPPGTLFKLYFSTPDASFGFAPTAKALDAYIEMMDGCNVPWLVSSFGQDCVDCGIAEESIKRGGHVQVGLEPRMGADGSTPTNVELVKKVVELAGRLGREVATPEVAAGILGLPAYPVGFGGK
ncbi:MAG: 3-keto-5-aminohexanoate cleavage protein [Pseudomonadales bacterium]